MIVVMTSWAPVRAFSTPAMPPHSAPPSRPATERGQQVDARGQVPGEADVAGRQRPEDQLALGADVEQARPERERDAEAGADQRRRAHQRGGERMARPHGAGDQRPVGLADGLARLREEVPGVGEEVRQRLDDGLAGERDQHGADEQRQDDRGDRRLDRRDPVGRRDRAPRGRRLVGGRWLLRLLRLRGGPGLGFGAHAVASAASAGAWAPAIISPMSSRAMSGVTTPTIRPSYMTAIRSDRA